MATTAFNDLITFSRGSNATVTGPNGLIQWAPSNVLTNSQDFEAAGWAKNSSTITTNSAVAPDGTQTADTWTPTSTATTAGVRLLGSFTVTSGSIQTASIYVKSAGKRWFFLTTPSAASANDNCWFDLQNGVVGTIGSSALSATITAVGNGWYRVTTTSVAVSATNYIFVSATTGDNTTAVTADGTGIHVWGAQLELGSTATTYNNTSVRNLLGFSEAFDNAAWTKSNSSIVTGAAANPVNGLFNAQKLMEDTATSSHRVSLAAGTVGNPETLSVYAKPAGRSWINITLGAGAFYYFNVTTGVVGSGAGGSASIVNVGSGWYRCSVTATRTSNTNNLIYASADGTAVSYTGDGNSGVYIYGAQLSNSASLDPYVPTPGAAPSSTAYYGPRFDYDPVTLLPRGLLVEEARTNLLLQSETFGTTWLVSNATISSNVTLSPDGTNNADKLLDNANPAQHFVYQSAVKAASSITYTLTSYMKSAEYTRSRLFLHDGAGNGFQADYNLAAGTAGAAVTTGTGWSAGSSAITPAGNGWYRCVITATSNTAVSVESRINVLDAAGNANFTGTGTSGIFIWGAQLEAGAFATSYIPTIASTVTRSADVATITGSLFSQWYNQQTGSFIAEWAINNANSTGRYIVKAFSPSVAQGYGLWLNSNSIDTRAWIGATSITAGNASLSTANKAAFGYRAGDNAASVNGAVAVASSATGPTDATYLEIGSAGASYFNGWLRSIRYVPVRAADFQLQQVTT